MSSLQPPPQRVLVVSMRFLGDALLSTPLAAAVKREWPDCSVDMLVFKGCEAILEGNPYIDHVLSVEERPSKREQWRQLRWQFYPRWGSVCPLAGRALPVIHESFRCFKT